MNDISSDKRALGGLILVALVAGMALPKLLSLGRAATRSLGGMTYRDGTADRNVRPTADPARGFPA